jgi:hypothetical protein
MTRSGLGLFRGMCIMPAFTWGLKIHKTWRPGNPTEIRNNDLPNTSLVFCHCPNLLLYFYCNRVISNAYWILNDVHVFSQNSAVPFLGLLVAGLSLQRSGFSSRGSPCEICNALNDTGADSSPSTSVFPLPIIIPPVLDSHLLLLCQETASLHTRE